jgi:hypothetical protein
LTPFRALREPDRRRRDEERPFRSKQGTGNKPKNHLTEKLPYKSANYRFRDPTDVKAMLQVLAAERKSDDADIRGSS